ARCAAVAAREDSGYSRRGRAFDRDWLYNAADVLAAQDRQRQFRLLAIGMCQGSNRLRSMGCEEERGALRMVVLADGGIQSKMAVKMASKFVARLADRMHVVTWGPTSDKTDSVLQMFKDKEMDFNGQMIREALYTGPDRPCIQALQEYIAAVGASLVVLCADDMDKMGSFVIHALKHINDVNMLVVRGDSHGKMFRMPGAVDELAWSPTL
ncbi:unnamed protein product, partial [Ostreobium quekettii]